MSLVRPPFNAGGAGYDIPYSVRLNDTGTPYLTRTFGVATTQNTNTTSLWIRRTELVAPNTDFRIFNAGSTNRTSLHFEVANKLVWGSTSQSSKVTDAFFRDTTSWYHIMAVMDWENATAADRSRLYVNGTRMTNFGTDTDPTISTNPTNWNEAIEHSIGRLAGSTSRHYDGLMAEFHFVDGQALEPSNFGEFDARSPTVWKPLKYLGTYGDNGFYLDFSNSADFGEDFSGNNNDWTANNLVAADQDTDSPTRQSPALDVLYIGGTNTFHQAGRDVNCTTNDGAQANIPMPKTGKWYWEMKLTGDNGTGSAGRVHFGLKTHNTNFPELSNTDVTNDYPYWALWSSSGAWRWNTAASLNTDTLPANFDVNSTCAFAYDADTGEFWGAHDEGAEGVTLTWQGITGATSPDPATGVDPSHTITETDDLFIFGSGTSAFTCGYEFYTNEDDFLFTPPSGFKPLSSANNQDVVPHKDPTDGFVQVLDTEVDIQATLATARTGWSDYIDIYKNRDTAEQWVVVFSDDATNMMNFDSTNAAAATSSLAGADDWHGCSMRVGASYGLYTTEVSHTNGAGDTDTAHGLTGVEGRYMGIVKISNTTGSWYVHNPDVNTSGYNLVLDTDAIEQNTTVYCEVDATNITVKSAAPTGTYRVIAWCDVPGFISVGMHRGNGAAIGAMNVMSGPPVWSMIKKVSTAVAGWLITNKAMYPENILNVPYLLADTTQIEQLSGTVRQDFLSNGIKMRGTGGLNNTSAVNYMSLAYLGGKLHGGLNVPPVNGNV